MDIGKLRPEELAEIDLHGLTAYDVEEKLIDCLNGLPKGVRALVVNHGFHRGTALKRMVRQDFYHWRMVDTQTGYNAGITYLILKG